MAPEISDDKGGVLNEFGEKGNGDGLEIDSCYF